MKDKTEAKRGISVLSIFLPTCAYLAFSALLIIPSRATEPAVVEKWAAGNWSIFCVTGKTTYNAEDCSLIAASVDGANRKLWAKVGIAFTGRGGDSTMTIRTPRLEFLSQGISLNIDEHQIGRSFPDRCSEQNCTTTVNLDKDFMQSIGQSKNLGIVYQVEEDESVIIPFNVYDFTNAAVSLAEMVDIDARFIDALRKPPGTDIALLQFKDIDFSSYLRTARSGLYTQRCRHDESVKHISIEGKPAKEVGADIDNWLRDLGGCIRGQTVFVSFLDRPEGKQNQNQFIGIVAGIAQQHGINYIIEAQKSETWYSHQAWPQ